MRTNPGSDPESGKEDDSRPEETRIVSRGMLDDPQSGQAGDPFGERVHLEAVSVAENYVDYKLPVRRKSMGAEIADLRAYIAFADTKRSDLQAGACVIGI